MATSTPVDTMMIVAMLVAMLTATTARPLKASTLVTPTTMTASRVGDEGFGRGSTCARGRRARMAA
eukprot:5065309-Pyramimonas_sp.AAC.1